MVAWTTRKFQPILAVSKGDNITQCTIILANTNKFAPVLGTLKNLFNGGINITECESELIIWVIQRPHCCINALVFSYPAFKAIYTASEVEGVVCFVQVATSNNIDTRGTYFSSLNIRNLIVSIQIK